MRHKVGSNLLPTLMRHSNYLTTNLVNFRSTITKQRRMKLY